MNDREESSNDERSYPSEWMEMNSDIPQTSINPGDLILYYRYDQPQDFSNLSWVVVLHIEEPERGNEHWLDPFPPNGERITTSAPIDLSHRSRICVATPNENGIYSTVLSGTGQDLFYPTDCWTLEAGAAGSMYLTNERLAEVRELFGDGYGDYEEIIQFNNDLEQQAESIIAELKMRPNVSTQQDAMGRILWLHEKVLVKGESYRSVESSQ